MTRVQEQQDALEATDALISEAIAMGVEKVRLAEETIRLREEARLAAEEVCTQSDEFEGVNVATCIAVCTKADKSD